jgi:hypothetical protein
MWVNSDPILYENFDGIRPGMSQQQVVQLLGCDPANIANHPRLSGTSRVGGAIGTSFGPAKKPLSV